MVGKMEEKRRIRARKRIQERRRIRARKRILGVH